MAAAVTMPAIPGVSHVLTSINAKHNSIPWCISDNLYGTNSPTVGFTSGNRGLSAAVLTAMNVWANVFSGSNIDSLCSFGASSGDVLGLIVITNNNVLNAWQENSASWSGSRVLGGSALFNIGGEPATGTYSNYIGAEGYCVGALDTLVTVNGVPFVSLGNPSDSDQWIGEYHCPAGQALTVGFNGAAAGGIGTAPSYGNDGEQQTLTIQGYDL